MTSRQLPSRWVHWGLRLAIVLMLAILPALGYLLILFIVRVFRLNLKMDENWTIRKAEEPSDQVDEGKR